MNSFKKQAGVTLIETMIGLALSMIVVGSMVGLMGNSMGTATRIIEMSQLTDELRNSMSMMTRDVRRANYNANAAYCFANSKCGEIGKKAPQFADILIDGECFTFGLDRNQDGNAAIDPAGGFRRRSPNGPGRIEMWVGNNTPNCAAGTGGDWMAVTDDAFVNITTFTVSDAESFSGSVTGEAGSTVTQRTRQLNIQLAGELILDSDITREIQDTIKVRNDYLN